MGDQLSLIHWLNEVIRDPNSLGHFALNPQGWLHLNLIPRLVVG